MYEPTAVVLAVNHRAFHAAAIRLGLGILRNDGVRGVFPEGSRGDGQVRTAKPGMGYFALRTGAVVVPVACHGTDALALRRTLRRPPARVTFGEAIRVVRVPAGRPLNRRAVAATTERIHQSVAKAPVNGKGGG